MTSSTSVGNSTGGGVASETQAGESADVSGSEGQQGCIPGASQACAGPGGCSGFQVCRADGIGWYPCDCSSENSTSSAGGDTSGADTSSDGSSDAGTWTSSTVGSDSATSASGDAGTASESSTDTTSTDAGDATGSQDAGETGGVCSPGSHRCDGPDLLVCAATGDGFVFDKTCESSALCNPDRGDCDMPLCMPGQRRCNGPTVQTCNAEQNGWRDVETCSGTNVECESEFDVNDCRGPFIQYECVDNDRWQHRSENAFNVQGWVDARVSEGSSGQVQSCHETLTFSGVAAKVEGDDSGKYWGAAMELRFCEESASDDDPGAKHSLSSCPFAGDQDKVEGVRFKLCGNSAPDELRVAFNELEGDSGYVILANPSLGSTYAVRMADAIVHWKAGMPATDPSDVLGVSWVIPSISTTETTPFDFCVTDIEILGRL